LRVTEATVVIDCHGVGYAVTVSGAARRMASEGSEITLEIYTYVREDQISLFGFATSFEKTLFELLLSVSGIGPKAAMATLTSTAPQIVVVAIAKEDILALTKIPGIGKKTAERLVLELKSKIKTLVPQTDTNAMTISRSTDARQRELVSALVNLGYRQLQTETVAQQILKEHPDVTLEVAIRESLRQLR